MSLAPEPGRWPEHASADRLTLGTGMAAVAAARVPGSFWDAYRDALRRLAKGVAEAEPGPRHRRGSEGAAPGRRAR